jgi:hypothetical protein
MNDYIEDTTFESEFDETIGNLYEIEGLKKIKELSRQLRTFFNYKTEVIKVRFRSNANITNNYVNTNFYGHKQEVESLSYEFITILKGLKRSTETIEEGIQNLFFENNKTQLIKLLELVEKLFKLIHIFAEEEICSHPRFLKFIIILTKNVCMTKKCLNAQFKEFYEELEINYHHLETELDTLLEQAPKGMIKKSKKSMEEKLSS